MPIIDPCIHGRVPTACVICSRKPPQLWPLPSSDSLPLRTHGTGVQIVAPPTDAEVIDKKLIMTNIMLDRVNHNLEKMIDIMEKFMEREW